MDESIGPTNLVVGCFAPSNDNLLLHMSVPEVSHILE